MQPHGKPLDVEVRLGAETRVAGIAFDNPTSLEDMRHSLRRLDGLVAEGLLALRRRLSFEFEFHFESPEDWSAFLERPRAGGLEVDGELLDKGLSALSRGEGGIVAVEEISAGAWDPRIT